MKKTTKPNRFLAAATFAAAAFAATLPGQASPIEVPNWNFEVPRSDFPDGLVEGSDVYMTPRDQFWYQYNIYTNGGPQRYWNPGDPNNPNAVNQARFADCGFGGEAPEGLHVGIAITRYNDNKNPDGTNTAAIGDYVRDFEALAQVLEDVLFDPAETYTLTVDVGHPPGNAADGGGAKAYEYHGYAVQLLAGGYEFNEGSLYAPCVYDGTVIAEDNNSVAITVNTFQTITVTYTPGDLTPEQETALAGQPIQIRLCALEDPADHSTTSIVAFDKVLLDGPVPPAPSGSFVVTIAPAIDPNTGYDLQWTSQTGMSYSVLTSTDLATPVASWTPVATDLPANPPQNSFNVPADGPRRFYVIQEAPAP